MAQLRQDVNQFIKQDTEIVVVGPEGPEAFRSYWERHRLPYTGLPDPKHQVLRSFGQEVNLFKLGRMPAQVVVDREGVARFAHYGHAMSDIPENRELLDLLEQINQQTAREAA
jgi:peroxiredoxin Q/BCP